MRTTLFNLRFRLQTLIHLSENHAMLLWGAVVGFVGALATVVFRECIALVQFLLTGRSGSLVGIAESLPWYLRVLVPTIGGLIAGLLLLWARRMPAGAAPDYMEAVAIGDGQIPVRHSVLRSLSSLF